MHGCIDRLIDIWMHACINGWMRACMGKKMHGCMHGGRRAWMDE